MTYLRYCILGLLVVGLVAVLSGCGSDGPAGPKGADGSRGPDGPDYEVPVPDDQAFAIAVFNGTTAHNGRNVVILTADTERASEENVLVATQIQRPPVIDGVDDGDGVWGDYDTEIDFSDRLPTAENYIESARMRAAYDEHYIYFMIQWTEVEHSSPDFTVGLNGEHRTWVYNGTNWSRRSVREDKVALFWMISGEWASSTDWATDGGCLIACHFDRQTGMFTTSDTTELEAWVWGSVTSDPTGFAVDATIGYQAVTETQPNGFSPDVGSPVSIENRSGNRPAYQHKMGVNYDGSYPLNLWQVDAFNPNAGWQAGATIPGVIMTSPSYSAGNVFAKGRFDNGTWTVEMVRARDTKAPDDVVF